MWTLALVVMASITLMIYSACLAVIVIKLIKEIGPQKLAAIVTDNARNMLNMRKLVCAEFPHLIEVRWHPVWHACTIVLIILASYVCSTTSAQHLFCMQVHDALLLDLHDNSHGAQLCCCTSEACSRGCHFL